MKCSQCGKEFAGKFCPECGAPAESGKIVATETAQVGSAAAGAVPVKPKKKKKLYQRWWFWAAAIVVAISIGNAIHGGNTNNDAKTPPTSAATSASVSSASSESASSSVQSAEDQKSATAQSSAALSVISYEAELSSGNYTAGIDFPAGDYDIEAVAGGGNVSSDNMYSGGINAIMGVSGDDMYEKKYSNIKLPEGTVLSLSGVTVKISSDNASGDPLAKREQPNTETVSLENGNFVAGDDFAAGVYDIVAVSGSGNVSSDNMYTGGLNAIMGTTDDEMYEKEYKNISLDDGTTLTISGVKVNLIPSK